MPSFFNSSKNSKEKRQSNSTITKFVWTEFKSTFNFFKSAIPSASFFALIWSSSSLLLIFSIAIIPAAAKIPTCLIPPPKLFLKNLACFINSLLPARIEPTGAHNPFERQNITESKCFVISLTSIFKAVEALNTLAPSRWKWRLCSMAIALTCIMYSTGRTAPPQ